MKNTGKAAKFFIVCAVIFVIGLTSAILGAAFGGVDGFKEVAEKREWIYGDPGQLVLDYIKEEDFDTINADGDFDLHIISEKCFGDKAWMKEHDLDDQDLDQITVIGDAKGPAVKDGMLHPTAGCVLVVRGDKVKRPEIKTNKGVLNINGTEKTTSGVHLGLSSTPVTPAVYVFVKDDVLASIKAGMLSGDLSIYGASVKKMDVESASGDLLIKDAKGDDLKLQITSGDVKMSNVTLKKVDVESASGDIEMSGKFTEAANIKAFSGDIEATGKFRGETEVTATSGDIDLSTDLSSSKYDLNVNAFSGDVKITEGDSTENLDSVPVTLTRKGGPNKLTIEATSGDLALTFGKIN